MTECPNAYPCLVNGEFVVLTNGQVVLGLRVHLLIFTLVYHYLVAPTFTLVGLQLVVYERYLVGVPKVTLGCSPALLRRPVFGQP